MPVIKPFRGYFFDTDSVELSDALAPSYDEITPEKYGELKNRDEHNIVRLLLGYEQGWYAQSGRSWNSWREDRTVCQDVNPAMYVLHQQFKYDGNQYTRRGFISLCDFSHPAQDTLYPHYKTHPQQREDRYRLLEATHAFFDQVVCCYQDEKNSLDSLLRLSTQTNPAFQFTLNGVDHLLWRVTTPATIAHAENLLAHQKAFIASGQHRIDAATRLREQHSTSSGKELRSEAFKYIPTFFCNTFDRGTFVLPIFRAITPNNDFSREDILTKLHKYFNLNQYNREEGLQRLREAKKYAFLFAFPGTNTCTLARLKSPDLLATLLETVENEIERSFDITLLNNFILEKIFEISKEDQLYSNRIFYSHLESEIYSQVQQKATGIFLNSPSISEISHAAFNEIQLPPGTTYFYPPIPAGMVIHSIDSEN